MVEQLTFNPGRPAADLRGLRLSEKERDIAVVIQHRRRDYPVQVKVLTEVTGLGERAVRNIVRDLVMEHGLPIGSVFAVDKPGFYWITDHQELQEAAQRQIHLGVSILRRGYALFGKNIDRLVGQVEADLG